MILNIYLQSSYNLKRKKTEMVEEKRLKIKIECRDLADLDTFSKSDPICLLEQLEADCSWTKVDQTETIDNDLNPKFNKELEIDYTGESQKIKFTVFDDDGGGSFELIGHVILKASQIYSLAENLGGTDALDLPLQKDGCSRKRGDIIISSTFF